MPTQSKTRKFLTTVVRKTKGLFVSDLAVLRADAQLNRHQRRAAESIARKRRKK